MRIFITKIENNVYFKKFVPKFQIESF